MKTIAIIGYGHMGKALEKGLRSGGLKKTQILTSNTPKENKRVAREADWIILATKPGVVPSVLQGIQEEIQDKVVISVAAAVSMDQLGKFAKKIVRIMPNLNVSYNEGVIGLRSNKHVSKVEKEDISHIFSKLGNVILCEKESELDALTVLAGSGPALVAYCIEMLAKSGESLGLSKKVSDQAALQTFTGTLTLLERTNQSAQQLQTAVATKGGVTEAVLNGFAERKIDTHFAQSLEAGYDKIKRIKEGL